MTTNPSFPAPVQVGTDGGMFVAGKIGLWIDPNHPEAGIQSYLFSTSGGGECLRTSDGAKTFLGSDQYVTIVPGSFVIG